MKSALFFGQNAVNQDSPEYDGWAGLLAGCVPDARSLAIAFANLGYESQARFSGWNIEGPQVPWLMTSQCTRAAWVLAHAALRDRCQPGDTIVIGNSGHGSQYDTLSAWNGGETLCFWDGQLRDTDLWDLLLLWPAGVNIIYLLDTCHSGGMDRIRLAHQVRSAPPWIRCHTPNLAHPASRSTPRARILQFCACRKNETAADGPHNGAYTGSLLETWSRAQEQGRPLTWQQWHTQTADLMASAFPTQHPILNVIGAGSELLNTPI